MLSIEINKRVWVAFGHDMTFFKDKPISLICRVELITNAKNANCNMKQFNLNLSACRLQSSVIMSKVSMKLWTI